MAARTITLHAFRAGTGKTTLLANIAVSLTLQGKRIGVVDADVHAPGLHILFGLPNPRPTLNDYLWDEVGLDKIVTRFKDDRLPHEIIAVPASSRLDDILRMLREGFDCSLLYTGLRALGERYQLDYLLVDTPPGFHSEALIIAIASNLILITLPPDEQDLAGTLLLLDAIRRRGEPPTFLLLNKLPAQHSSYGEALVRQARAHYGLEVMGSVPYEEGVALLASRGVFALQHPQHPWSQHIDQVAARILDFDFQPGILP